MGKTNTNDMANGPQETNRQGYENWSMIEWLGTETGLMLKTIEIKETKATQILVKIFLCNCRVSFFSIVFEKYKR